MIKSFAADVLEWSSLALAAPFLLIGGAGFCVGLAGVVILGGGCDLAKKVRLS